MSKNIKDKVILFTSFLTIIIFFRYIPHPPNFTPLIALTMYGSIFFGLSALPVIILAFAISDFFIGFHSLLIWTWGSLLLVGLTGKYYKSIFSRLFGSLISAFIFYFITNFGVWLFSNFYEKSFFGLIECYTLAIPFFGNTLLGTLVLAIFIETALLIKKNNFINKLLNNFFT